MKVVINGESFDYENNRPMSEALAIERVYERRYAEWESDLQAGSARALCVLAWIIWRRDGRDVPYQDIIDGKADFDLAETMESIVAAATAEAEETPDPPEPPPAPGPSAPAGTRGTRKGTKPSSAST